MQLEHYITQLLYRYHCVVVPQFGAFLAQTVSAKIGAESQTVHPPTKIISFNQQLQENDGLLISFISKALHLEYDSLLDEVQQTVAQWQLTLQEEKSLTLEGLGTLSLGAHQKIQFLPQQRTNYLVTSFGLADVGAAPVVREELKKDIELIEDRVPFVFTPQKREAIEKRPWLRYAAIGLLCIALGTSGYQLRQSQQQQQAFLVRQQVQEVVSKEIQEATFFDTDPLELPALRLNVNKGKVQQQGPLHHVVAGAFRIQANADKKITALSQQGYRATYIGTNAYGLHQVAYGSFTNATDALRLYREIKRTTSPDVWILSEK